jgi:hypothetical protein
VTRESDPAVWRDRAGHGLGDVVHQRSEAQREAAGHVVGERLVKQRANRGGARTIKHAARVALELEQLTEYLQGVSADIEVVVAALADPAERVELGQHNCTQAEVAQQADAVRGALAGEDPLQLTVDALGGDLGQARSNVARRRDRRGVGLEVEFTREPDESHRAQRIAL